MSIISEFISSVREIVSVGSTLQREQRQDIQTIVGELADELQRSIDLLNIYFDGIKGSGDNNKLAAYLREGSNKVFTSFQEFRVCAGLYELKDRFKGIFDPVGASVGMGNKGTIVRLIDDLAYGERMVFDDLSDIFDTLRQYAGRLDSAQNETEENKIKDALLSEVQDFKNVLGKNKEDIKNTARAIIDGL
jgi:hypothetical protein